MFVPYNPLKFLLRCFIDESGFSYLHNTHSHIIRMHNELTLVQWSQMIGVWCKLHVSFHDFLLWRETSNQQSVLDPYLPRTKYIIYKE